MIINSSLPFVSQVNSGAVTPADSRAKGQQGARDNLANTEASKQDVSRRPESGQQLIPAKNTQPTNRAERVDLRVLREEGENLNNRRALEAYQNTAEIDDAEPNSSFARLNVIV